MGPAIYWPWLLLKYIFFELERKPALLDNIWQILSAPLFVVIELFDLIGLRTK